METLSDPLFALLISTAFVTGFIACLLSYQWYTQWRYARFERLAIENELLDGYV